MFNFQPGFHISHPIKEIIPQLLYTSGKAYRLCLDVRKRKKEAAGLFIGNAQQQCGKMSGFPGKHGI
jgi:hypothetical protein